MRLDDGTPIEADKEYSVAGWASVSPNPREGKDIWEVVAEYLRAEKVATVKKLNTPKLLNVKGNPGLADYNA